MARRLSIRTDGFQDVLTIANPGRILNSSRIHEVQMIASRHTQSLTEFRQKAGETLERLNKTGEAEILTVNGEARAVLVPPSLFDELSREAQIAQDVSTIRKSMRQLDEDEGMDASAFFASLRKQLQAHAG